MRPHSKPIPKPTYKPPKPRKKLESKKSINPTPLVPASEEQRAKVAALACIVCDRKPADPAHLVPRKHGGCDHADCVIPLCRTHHRLYDSAQLNLGAHLGRSWRAERRHARGHVSAERLRRALAGRGW